MTHHDHEHGSGHKKADPNSVEQRVARELQGVDFPGFFKSWLPFFIGLIATAIVGWAIWPTLVYSKKEQPFNFNHLIHSEEAGMDCDECHSFDANGRFSGVPSAEVCLTCHTWSNPQNEENEAEMAFLKEYVTEDDELKKPLKWYIYSKQPDCVYFSHIAHVEKGGFECSECHGEHGSLAQLPPFEENRLTGYSRLVYERMKMTDCADCHTKHYVTHNKQHGNQDHHDVTPNNACFVCHK